MLRVFSEHSETPIKGGELIEERIHETNGKESKNDSINMGMQIGLRSR